MRLLVQQIGDSPARACDEKCYGAQGEACHCICGGKNHGVGLEEALANVKEEFGELAEVLIEFGGISIGTSEGSNQVSNVA